MWNIQANIYMDEEAKQKDPVIGDLLEKVMKKLVTSLHTGHISLLFNYSAASKPACLVQHKLFMKENLVSSKRLLKYPV